MAVPEALPLVLALAFLAAALAELALTPRLFRRPPRLPPAAPGPLPRASVIVPAREEADRLPRLLESLARLDHPDFEVIVVDGSRPGHPASSRAEAAAFAARDARFRLVEEPPLPPGWVGKPWAAWTGRAHATGAWLLFTDADTEHAPDSLRRALQAALAQGTPLLTGVTRQRLGTFWERVAMPPIFTLIQAATGGATGTADPARAVANGQYVLVEAATYDRLGGHEAVRGSVVEDLALARVAARAGAPALFFDLSDAVSVRMYDGFGGMLRGWRKNVATGAVKTPPLAFVQTGALFATGLLALPVALVAPWWTLGLAALAAAAVATWRVRRAQEPTEGAGWRHALLHPLGYAFFGAVLLLSAFDRATGRGPEWKGRRYAPEPRR